MNYLHDECQHALSTCRCQMLSVCHHSPCFSCLALHIGKKLSAQECPWSRCYIRVKQSGFNLPRPRNLSLRLALSSSTFFHSSALGFPRDAKRKRETSQPNESQQHFSDANVEGSAAAAETADHRPHTGVPGAEEIS